MLKFLVFADLHYKKGMYAAGVEHLNAILDRAARQQVDFVVHLGDLCNDYPGSPELLQAYLRNAHDLPVYGIYGNHELKTKGNTMAAVTPQLCNREVIFPAKNVGYWHTDVGKFRLIGLDTNYSWNEELQEWEHNREASWGEPQGNTKPYSLSPRQLAWLESLLKDAADQKKKVIIFSHSALSGQWYSSLDAPKVRELFQQYKGTVLMNINGHLHTDHFAVVEDVAYFDVHAALNGFWKPMEAHHYEAHHTYAFTDYDHWSNPQSACQRPLTELKQAKNTWFFEEPLSAIVTVTETGQITVEGNQIHWRYGIVPENLPAVCHPEISSPTAVLYNTDA